MQNSLHQYYPACQYSPGNKKSPSFTSYAGQNRHSWKSTFSDGGRSDQDLWARSRSWEVTSAKEDTDQLTHQSADTDQKVLVIQAIGLFTPCSCFQILTPFMIVDNKIPVC